MARLTPKAARLVRHALNAAINESWAGGNHPDTRPTLEQDAKNSRRKLRDYIAELEQAVHELQKQAHGG